MTAHETIVTADGDYVSASCLCGWAKVGSLWDYSVWEAPRLHRQEVFT